MSLGKATYNLPQREQVIARTGDIRTCHCARGESGSSPRELALWLTNCFGKASLPSEPADSSKGSRLGQPHYNQHHLIKFKVAVCVCTSVLYCAVLYPVCAGDT